LRVWIGERRLLLLSPIDSQVCEQIRGTKVMIWKCVRRPSLIMRGGQLMVEQQPGIFRQVGNDVGAIEERSAVCRPLGRPIPHSRGGGSVLGQGGR
jgi:hypothetical protein